MRTDGHVTRGQGLDRQANPVRDSDPGRSQEVTGSQRTVAEGPTVVTGSVRSSRGSKGGSRGGARGAMKRAREQQRESMARWLSSKPTTTLAQTAVGDDRKPQGSLEVAWQPGPGGPARGGRTSRGTEGERAVCRGVEGVRRRGWIART